MSPIVHSSVALLGWQKTAENKNLKTLFLFLLISNLPDLDFLFSLIFGKKTFGLHQLYTHNVFFVCFAVLLFFPILKQKIGIRDITATFICYLGVVIIATHGDILGLRFSSPLGVILALASTVIWALYWIYNTKDDRDPIAGLLLNFIFGLPFVLVYYLLFSTPKVVNFYGLVGVVYIGLFEMGITFVLWLSALKLSENTAKVGNLIFISPFLSLVFIRVFVGEEILMSTLLGLVFIITGLMVQQIKRGKRERT